MSGNVPTDNSNARQAVVALEMLSHASPLNAKLQSALAAAYEVAGEPQKAARARVIAQALTERNAPLLCDMATAYLNHAQIAQAEHWYRISLAIDPELAVAHQNLASVLRQQGKPDEADEHLKRAYSRQAVFVEPGREGAPRVLMLCAGSVGNIPIKHLMPDGRYTQIRYFVEYAKESELASVPKHDAVLNVIGDPDASASEHTHLDTLLASTRRRVLNAPAHVARTRRDRLARLLADIEGAVVPATRRIERTAGQSLADAIEPQALPYPVIVRPAASHGGQGMLLANTRTELETHEAETHALASASVVYATAYHDYRSADGHFRKYRVIFVDREPYPYHLAISPQWLVHYFSADMLKAPEKLDEERRFLEDPQAVLGARAMRILREIGQRLALDYAGIDFSMLPGGDLLVFEANATMLVHPEAPTSPLAHKNGYVQAIVDAFGAMVDRSCQT
ncbi:MAG TPA: hypothetical protein VL424_03145 [Pararobbsia sp.]|nr:hypothetical protein [Pararobbsia sp.]